MILHLDCVPLQWDNEHNRPIMASNHDEYMVVLKQHRNVLLSQSDWRVGVDSPLSEEEKQEWITYRKYLRELTDHIPAVLGNTVTIIDPPTSGGAIRVMTPNDSGIR